MDTSQLVAIGLTEPLAKAYLALLENGRLRPPQLAELIAESRTNAYSLLDKLVEFELVRRIDDHKKISYEAEHPSALEAMVNRQRQEVEQRDRSIKTSMGDLLSLYQIGNERPGIKFYEGKDGITSIYKDQIVTKQPVLYVKSSMEIPLMSFNELHHIRNLFPKLGIHRHGITQDRQPKHVPAGDNFPVAESDAAMLLHRTWITEDDYTAPVEWAAYGNKLSIVSYGEEAMGMVIESAPIADAFRQLFALLDEGIRRRPGYNSMPVHAKYTATPNSLKKSKSPSTKYS